MSTLFASLLVLHVLLGLVGVMASYRVAFLLFKKVLSKKALVGSSMIAFSAYVISWFTGGWYYWKYYGANVKPIILKGDYPWAHAVLTETKEHVFLFLPFASFLLMLLVLYKFDAIASDSVLRKRVVFLSSTITVIATCIALSGVLISGGAH